MGGLSVCRLRRLKEDMSATGGVEMTDYMLLEVEKVLEGVKKALEQLAKEVRNSSIEQSRIGDALLDIRDILSSKERRHE